VARELFLYGRLYLAAGEATLIKLTAVVWILLYSCPASALNPAAQAALDKNIAEALAAFEATSVSVAVVENEKLSYVRAFGNANLASHIAATPATRYAVGSISKQFTASALLLAEEQGKVSLDDKVGKYFPDLTRANEVTIRELLSHTSGYEDYAPQDYIIPAWTKPTTPKAIMDNWAKKPLNFDPGTKWQYSNTNYVIAGAILEKVTGESLLLFLQEHIFKPLGMNSAGEWIRTGGVDADAYTRFALGPPRPVAREGDGWYFAAGELSMTPSDLAKWDVALLQKKILSEKSYAELTREVKLKNGDATHYALGLSLGEQEGTPTLSHGGEVSGFLATNTVFPKKGDAVIVLSNEDSIGMIGAISRQITEMLLSGDSAPAMRQDELVRQVLDDLQHGNLKRELFTDDALAYFSDTARRDYKASLEPLGRLVLLSRQSEQQRGGMTHLSYRAHFERDSVALNIYLLPSDKIEQFLVEEQF
jgi:CubicO group peptidase (beta-lactamase class C family)